MTQKAMRTMKLKRLQTKIALWTGVCLFVTAALIVTYAAVTMNVNAKLNREEAIENAKAYAGSVAREHANDIQVKLEVALDAARTLAQVLSAVKHDNAELRLDRTGVNSILRTVLVENPLFVGTYTAWEPNAFDGLDSNYVNTEGHDASGRFIPYWNRSANGAIVVEPLLDYETEGAGDYYQLPKKTRRECLIDPYVYPVQGVPTLIASLVVPIIVEQTFYGIAGIDLRLDTLQLLVDDVKGLYDGTARLHILSHNGTIAAATGRPELSGKHVREISTNWEDYVGYIQQGDIVVEEDKDTLVLFTPLHAGYTKTPWSVNVRIPEEKVTAMADAQMQQAFYDVWRMLGIGLAGTVLALGVVWIVARSITRPVAQAVEVAEQLSQGNLNLEVDVTSADEVGQLQRAMKLLIAQLQGFASDIQDAAEQVASGSKAMSSSAAEMSNGSTQQAAAAEEASSSMEEMAANIRQNADNAVQTEKIAIQAAQSAKQSGSAVAETVKAMKDIVLQISIIEEIARQTHTLSLNATIEAAKAEQYGKGFAVVASEVRALASRSQNAAAEINAMAGNSIAVAERAGELLTMLVPDIQKTAELVQEINAASREQNTGTQQINQAIQQLDSVTQQNSANSEELAATAEQLAMQAVQLQASLDFFNIGDADRDGEEHQERVRRSAHSVGRKEHGSNRSPSNNVLLEGDNIGRPGDERDEEFERY